MASRLENVCVLFFCSPSIWLLFWKKWTGFFKIQLHQLSTGKSLSEALIFASTNPQYDDRLFIELQVQYMKVPSSNLGKTCFVHKLFLTFRTIFVHNMFSLCSAKRSASDKDLSVHLLCCDKFVIYINRN